MRVKLDENLGRRTVEVFTSAHHDVATAYDENLAGIADERVMAVCIEERRVLVTLDLDFANPLRFPPDRSPGIAVFRVTDLPGRSELVRAAITLCGEFERADITGKLWIVDGSRVREYRPDDEAE